MIDYSIGFINSINVGKTVNVRINKDILVSFDKEYIVVKNLNIKNSLFIIRFNELVKLSYIRIDKVNAGNNVKYKMMHIFIDINNSLPLLDISLYEELKERKLERLKLLLNNIYNR